MIRSIIILTWELVACSGRKGFMAGAISYNLVGFGVSAFLGGTKTC